MAAQIETDSSNIYIGGVGHYKSIPLDFSLSLLVTNEVTQHLYFPCKTETHLVSTEFKIF